MTTLQVEFRSHELLESHRYAEPLVAGGVRCHGGFDDDGRYVSPRTKHRVPAILAWQQQRAEQFEAPILDLPLDTWPAHYPNLDQARFLIRSGVPEPIIATLTRIGIVEGFGAMLRFAPVPELAPRFDEDIRGTALAHLTRGLFDAHGRDEAGFEDEGGHKQMWFAARDLAFEHPVTEDDTELMMARMGFGGGGAGGAAPDPDRMRREALARRLWPDDIDFDLELLAERMARILLIEISAYHAFAWAEDLLADVDLVAGEGEAARLVAYIRSDEAPHVEYLKTALSEMRDRTMVGTSGRRHAGRDLIGRTWDRALAQSLGERRQQGVRAALADVEGALDSQPAQKKADLMAEFHALGTDTEVAA